MSDSLPKGTRWPCDGVRFGALLLVSLIWGSEWLVTRDLDSPPLGALALRYAIASVVLGSIVAAHRSPLPGRRRLVAAAVVGITFTALPVVLTSWASERVSPGLLVVILAMTPLLAALKEGRASGGLLVPLIGGVGGTALLAAQGLSFAPTQWAGAAAAVTAAGLVAGSIVYVKRELADLPAVLLAAIQLASGAVALALWGVIVEGRSGFAWDWKLVRVETMLAILGSALALPLYYWLLRNMESFQLTASQWLVTVVGFGEGLFVVRELPGWRMLAGGALILASLGALVNRRGDDDTPVTLR